MFLWGNFQLGDTLSHWSVSPPVGGQTDRPLGSLEDARVFLSRGLR